MQNGAEVSVPTGMVHDADDTTDADDPLQSTSSVSKSPFAFLILITQAVMGDEPSKGIGQLIVTERPLNTVSGYRGASGYCAASIEKVTDGSEQPTVFLASMQNLYVRPLIKVFVVKKDFSKWPVLSITKLSVD